MDKINKLVISEILKNIPRNINPVNYLSDILCISNKSVYRRIKGEIPFTITEVLKLSDKLNFSIDQILDHGDMHRASFILQSDNSNSPEESFYRMLSYYHKLMLASNKATYVESFVTLNHIPVLFTVFFERLFKFSYYQWMHHSHTNSIKYHFKDAIMPPRILSLQKEIIASAVYTGNITYILDSNMYLSTLKEISYYYNCKLITDKELESIKKDLNKLVDWFETILSTGVIDKERSRMDIYLSSLNLKVSSAYNACDDTVTSHFFIYTIDPIYTINSLHFARVHKKWFNTIKKYSVLITRSNEMLRAAFLEKQRMYIENILNL
ncbi:MAG: hypothetical protein LBJ60_07760 [Tannerellaceae bacterium]|jgi:hypothetical protein|nr:hypothetical protein [Tannerellaceae bacterium]